jgi:hypothetical protein
MHRAIEMTRKGGKGKRCPTTYGEAVQYKAGLAYLQVSLTHLSFVVTFVEYLSIKFWIKVT